MTETATQLVNSKGVMINRSSYLLPITIHYGVCKYLEERFNYKNQLTIKNFGFTDYIYVDDHRIKMESGWGFWRGLIKHLSWCSLCQQHMTEEEIKWCRALRINFEEMYNHTFSL
jgi:hypothetical protein